MDFSRFLQNGSESPVVSIDFLSPVIINKYQELKKIETTELYDLLLCKGDEIDVTGNFNSHW